MGDIIRNVLVRKLRPDGSEAYRWPGRLLALDQHAAVVVARFNAPTRNLGYVTFEPNDLFVETYYFDRWFNIYQVYSTRGDLKGWYCNVGAPAELGDGQLRYTDLVLDVFVPPSGEHLVLDEEEFEERSPGYPPHLIEAARAGLQALVEVARRRALPSHPFAEAAAVLDEP